MGKKSRRSRQKQPQPESFRPDAEVMRLVEEIFRGTRCLISYWGSVT